MAKLRRKARVSVRDMAEEIIRRALAAHPDGVMPYVLRLSDPPTPDEQLQIWPVSFWAKLSQSCLARPSRSMSGWSSTRPRRYERQLGLELVYPYWVLRVAGSEHDA
jgi:hypothetical protein